ncbi:MAG: phosphoribosylanthranilate isomerase [Acidobacteriota bacterium]|nr:phosphoribosylanthranilate isomerase [Acidobacteriota bacterium]
MARVEIPFVVKVCGITCEEDARGAVAAGANALGFNFYSKSTRYISPERAREIVAAVSGGYLKVGVFVNASEPELLSIGATVPLDVLQLHGEPIAIPDASPFRIWRSIPGGSPNPKYNERIEAYLLDAVTPRYGGSGQQFDWSLAANFNHPAIIAGGLDASNVAEAIAIVRPWGVDACSRIEASPGKKDLRRVHDFIAAALKASESLLTEEIKL